MRRRACRPSQGRQAARSSSGTGAGAPGTAPGVHRGCTGELRKVQRASQLEDATRKSRDYRGLCTLPLPRRAPARAPIRFVQVPVQGVALHLHLLARGRLRESATRERSGVVVPDVARSASALGHGAAGLRVWRGSAATGGLPSAAKRRRAMPFFDLCPAKAQSGGFR